MFGCFVAGISTYEGKGSVWDKYERTFSIAKRTCDGLPADKVIACEKHMKQGRQYNYFNDYRIRNAPWFTFLWAETFPLGFAPEYFLPILIGFFVSTAETIGDVTMSASTRSSRPKGPISRNACKAGCSRTASTRSSPASSRARRTRRFRRTTASSRSRSARPWAAAAVQGLLVRAFWLILFGVFGKIRSGVQLHSYLCGRGRRAPSLQSPTVSVTHIAPLPVGHGCSQ